MNTYLVLKYHHILSAIIPVGITVTNGLMKTLADRTGYILPLNARAP